MGVVKVLGLAACAALVLAGTLLVAGSSGILGERAPDWIEGAAVAGVIGYFAWVVMASYSTRRPDVLGVWVFWLGMLAGISVVVQPLISVLMSVIDPGFVVSNATIPLVVISGLLIWLCLPAWLIALTIKMRARGISPAHLEGIAHR